jgi:2-iminobutanoate/2-iminopropanoate deaminase
VLPSQAEARKQGYSQGVKSGNILFLSGHVALDSNGEVVGKGDFSKQVRCVFDSLAETLRSKGASLNDIVKITVYLTDIGNLQEFRKIRGEYFKDWFPASTLVQVGSLIMKELMIEIDGVAVLKD